jgi:hypothetical protein
LDHDSWRESVRQHEVEYDDHPEDRVFRQLVIASGQATLQKLWMIQGEPGSGKSTLVEHWIDRWAAGLEAEPKEGIQLPVPVRFRDLPAECLPGSATELAEALWKRAFVGELSSRYPHLYAESRRVMFVPVWFLDGWDEARSDDCRTDGFLDRLRKLPGLKVLTCRTAVLASIRKPTKLDNHLQPNRLYTLRDLDSKEQLALLNKRLTEQEYYLARWLQRDGLEKALYERWTDPRYDETLALLASQLVQNGEASTVEDVLIRFVEWGQEKYDSEPDYLLNRVHRSPLRITMHLVTRAGLPDNSVPKLLGRMIEHSRASDMRVFAALSDWSPPGCLLAELPKHARALLLPRSMGRAIKKSTQRQEPGLGENRIGIDPTSPLRARGLRCS